MTAPTDRLAQLSIAGKMTSRSRKEAQQERRRREAELKLRQQSQQRQDPQASTSTYLPPTTEPDLVESATSLQYHTHGIPDHIRATAIRGLEADNTAVEKAKAHTSPANGPYIAIQIVERLRLSVYTLPKDGRMVECSCAEFAVNRPKICSHLYWLYDRINKLQQGLDISPPRALSVRDIETTLTQISNLSSTRIDNLPEEISPVWTEPDDEVDHEVEDMLAVLDQKSLSGDYDEDFYTSLPSSDNHQFCDLVIPGDLFKTIFALARHDRILRERLSIAITRESADKDLLRKLSKRRKSCFEKLSTYEKEGPEMRTNQIARSCWALRDIINKLSEYRQRVYEVPNPVFDGACAKIAIKILQTICTWNRDIYANATWLQGTTHPPPSAKDRNLYIYFTTHPPHDPSSTTINTNFLISFLTTDLPTITNTPYQQDLTHLATRLTDFNAPAPLLQPLLEHLQTLQSTPATPLAELENYQSLSISSTRSSRTGSSSSSSEGSSCASVGSQIVVASTSRNTRRLSSAMEAPGAQRRRLG